MSHFYFALTNSEVEALLKQELNWFYPQLKPSYSRPGFLTLKAETAINFNPWMARLSGICLGKKSVEDLIKLPKAWLWKRQDDFNPPASLTELNQKSLFKIGEKVSLIMMVGENEFWICPWIMRKKF